ncbi:MAG: rhodanese-like domain-containing protein [Verrucomicrobiota bacterium]|nr:rhodanese-like domain-containing protein [Verrucomicrobiota bacterium]MCC6819324.1 rhodanese-like domain-containing protein [Limisphaerales bacterium]
MNELRVTLLKLLAGGVPRPTLSLWAGLAGCGCASLLLITAARAAEINLVHHVNPAEAQKLIADKKVVVLDVRTSKEFAAGHITGATNINFLSAEFAKAIAGLDTNQAYLVHCAVGGRSTQALPKLEKLQLQSIYHLDGGIKAWEKAGLPVAK